MAEAALAARPAFTPAPVARAGLRLIEPANPGFALVQARAGSEAALAATVQDAFGLALPTVPARIANADVAFIATAPGQWFAELADGGFAFADDLVATLADHAHVSDASSGYAVATLEGSRAAELLQSGAFLDLEAAPNGYTASTVFAHIGITLLRRLAPDRFGLVCFRSYADSLAAALSANAAARGLTLSIESGQP